MLELIKHTTVLVLSLLLLGSVADALPTSLKKALFWAILHYILYQQEGILHAHA